MTRIVTRPAYGNHVNVTVRNAVSAPRNQFCEKSVPVTARTILFTIPNCGFIMHKNNIPSAALEMIFGIINTS
jgi:hypothetical protein